MTPLTWILIVLAVAAFACGVLNAMGKCPPWVASLLLAFGLLLLVLPPGK